MKNLEIKTLNKDAKKGFSFLAGINRPINPSQVTKLSNSIDKMGIVRPVVIANIDFIDGQLVKYMIDGQHLYTACLRLNIDVPYCEINIPDLQTLVEHIALLNASSKSWTLLDYIQSWKCVNKDYILLQKMFERYDIELSQLSAILHNGYCNPNAGGNNIMAKLIKSGKFSILNIDDSIKVLNNITDALKIVPRFDRVSNKIFISAFCNFTQHPLYNHKITIKWLKDNKDKFALSTQDPEEFNKLFKSINQ